MVLQRENVLSSKEYSAGVEQHPWSSLGALIRLMPRPWPTTPIVDFHSELTRVGT